jgi:hypothetical protein
LITIDSCSKVDNNITHRKIVGKWENVDGRIGDYGEGSGEIVYWEFTGDGLMYTNDDLISSSTYSYDHSTKILQLWAGVRITEIEWISDNEIEADIIGRLNKK